MLGETEKSGKQVEKAGESPSGLTRRQWLLRLGEAAALAGFSGMSAADLAALPAETSAAADLQASTSLSAVALPPGLYDPSADHLTHVLMREQRFVTPPPGTETEYAAPPPKPYTPAFFSAAELPVLRRLVWLMLNASSEQPAPSPPVDAETVGEMAVWIDLVVSQSQSVREAARSLSAPHRALAVRYYGAEEVRQLEASDPQKVWRHGLAWLHEESSRLASGGFLNLSESQQSTLLSRLDKLASGPAPEAEHPGPRLYRLLKRQVIQGYYTSEAGLKELDYQGNAFHGESPGCPKK
ncbi:MAG TPA: gluconate 2-dehydrogenase subunit 3 family protein [Terriglobia bacterium]|nr:gluconate 2-dehydrogenase subunit 3 family protein [Terriglobia bacterium]